VDSSSTTRISVGLVQQGIWNMPLESMPLASAYLKATALADPVLRDRADIRIHNFRGGVTNATIANALFSGDLPDMLAFSVLGWNYRAFGELAATFKQLNPDGWVVFGGTHVSEQADRVFRMFPEVDIVVNGEGELTMRELIRQCLDGTDPRSLDGVLGIAYQTDGGDVVTNAARPRIEDLDIIPSPFLTGALELTDAAGAFRYDVALMETNRGCPHKCAFCYWGGAVGQKVRAFPMDRLRAELALFGKMKVHTIVACDANFGLLKQDVEFVRALIETRDRYGFPQALETSWAKNKSSTFYTIVKMLKEAGMRSSFTLALQTLSEGALDTMNRRNMKVNEWEDLVDWLGQEGLDCYAELIWGAPGDTIASFMEGYDRLSRKVSRIAIYPLLLLPNTDYVARREELGIKSVRGDHDDFEYVLAHNTMSFADNQLMQRFVFWARVVAENAVLRHSWAPLRHFAGLSQSTVLKNLDAWVEDTEDPAAVPLRACLASALGGTGSYGGAIQYFFTEPAAKELLCRWWRESIAPLVPQAHRCLLDEVFRYDILTQPIYCPDGIIREPGVEMRMAFGKLRYIRRAVRLEYDVPAIVMALRAGGAVEAEPSKRVVDLYYLAGAESAVTSTNHEIVMHHMGQTIDALLPSSPPPMLATSIAV
jgi:radical SAM C-methyltransferase